jgi:hypothetical protein
MRTSTAGSLRGIFIALIGLMLMSLSAHATDIPLITFAPGDYDNTANTVIAGPTPVNNQTTGLFRDVFWYSLNNGAPRVGSGDYINQGNSLVLSANSAVPGSGPYTALNFTGPAVSGGQSYLSIYDTTPADGTTTRNLFDASVPGGLHLSADVLFVKHSSSAGVVSLYNEGQDGLALLAHNGDGNNADNATVDLVFQSPGSGIVLNSVTLSSLAFQTAASANGNKIAGTSDFWYRAVMDLSVTGDTFNITGSFYNHSDPNNPTSALGSLITTLSFSGSLSSPGNLLDLTNPGEVGVMAMGNESISLPDNVGVSITNFQETGQTVPDGGITLILLSFGLLGLGGINRKIAKS